MLGNFEDWPYFSHCLWGYQSSFSSSPTRMNIIFCSFSPSYHPDLYVIFFSLATVVVLVISTDLLLHILLYLCCCILIWFSIHIVRPWRSKLKFDSELRIVWLRAADSLTRSSYISMYITPIGLLASAQHLQAQKDYNTTTAELCK